jgi:hypothetical protein
VSQLLTLSPPAPSIAEIVSGDLHEMIEWSRTRGSRAGYFAALYTHVGAAIELACERGDFVHTDLLLRVHETFFARYLDAFDDHRSGLPTTATWNVAFDATASDRLCIVQHLLLGMNAHINLDLAIAVADALDPEEINAFHGDFNRMNALLGSLVDCVSADLALASPLLCWINRLGSRPDDVIINFSMRLARDHSWRSATLLSTLRGAPRARAVAALDAHATALARGIVRPPVPARLVARAARAGERGDVVEVIGDLLR